nr:putative integron gene cassette protein [uncultured bacterium]
MIVIELVVNGKLVSSAGSDNLSVLSHTLTARGKLGSASQGTASLKDSCILETSLTGLTSSKDEPMHVHLHWHHAHLSVGDELTLRIVERSTADNPLPERRTGEA